MSSAVKSFDPCGTLNKQYSDLLIYAGLLSSNKLFMQVSNAINLGKFYSFFFIS